MSLFDGYPNDERHIRSYIDYQSRYRTEPRESDKVILRMLEGVSGSLLDIGCSTGNLLFHIRHQYPRLNLVGGDLSRLQIETCMRDPELAGIEFRVMSVLDLPKSAFDVITANAILYGFDDGQFAEATESISRALTPGGRLIAFDFFHPFRQELAIVERTDNFPDGHPLHFRSYERARKVLTKAGFKSIEFLPFELPIELPFKGYDSIATHTKAGMQFRGTLFQPWCHLIAQR